MNAALMIAPRTPALVNAALMIAPRTPALVTLTAGSFSQ